MILGIYSIRDSLSGFMTPVVEQNDAIALRNFTMACQQYPSDPGVSLMKWKPDDFTFFKLGEFDSESGIISPLSAPEYIASGLSVSGVVKKGAKRK